MEQENQYLKERITYLEMLLDLNAESLQKAIVTNEKLIQYIKSQDSSIKF